MCYKLSNGFQMPAKAMHKLLIVTAPFPGDQVPILSPSDEDLIVVENNQICYEVLFDVKFCISSQQGSLLYLNEISQLIEANAFLVPSNY